MVRGASVDCSHAAAARLRPADGRRARCPIRPPLVHRRPGLPEELRHHPGRARGRPRRGHDLRRVGHPGLQPGAGIRHARRARPEHLRDRAVAGRGRSRRPHVLRHQAPVGGAVRGRPPLRAEAQPRARPRQGLHLLHRARDGVLHLRVGRHAAGAARPRRLLRPHPARHGERAAPPDDRHARGDGHPGRVQLPRARPEPARDRPALHRRAHDGRQRHDVPPGREAGRHTSSACTPRSCPSRSRARSVPGCTRRCRCSRATSTRSTTRATSTGSRRSGKCFIAGLLHHAREITAVTNQTVNSYKRLIAGYEAPVHICWARNNESALVRLPGAEEGQGELDPHRVPLPRPGVQPVPRVLGDARRRPQGRRGGLRPPARGHQQHLRDDAGGAGGRGHRLAAAEPRRGHLGAWRSPSSWPKRWGSTCSSTSSATSGRSGLDYKAHVTPWELDRYLGSL